jgi:hypothetical protein
VLCLHLKLLFWAPAYRRQPRAGFPLYLPAGRQVFLPKKGKKDVISPEVSGSNANSVCFKHFVRIKKNEKSYKVSKTL